MMSINENIPRINKKPKTAPSGGGGGSTDVKLTTATFQVTIDTNPYAIPTSSSLPSVGGQQMATVGFGKISYKKLAAAVGFTPETIAGLDENNTYGWLPVHFGVYNASRGSWYASSGGKSFEVVDVNLEIATIAEQYGRINTENYTLAIIATVYNKYTSSATPTYNNINMVSFGLGLWRSDGGTFKTSGLSANLSTLI